MRKSILKFKNPILLIVLLTVFGKIIIYLAELLIAIKFGASHTTDAFVIARSIPLRIGSITSWALYSAFVPFYLMILKENKEKARVLSLRFSQNVLLISFISSLLLVLGANLILKVLAPGFDDTTLVLSSKLLRIMSWTILLGSAAAVLQSINASRGRQLTASMAQPLNNLVVLLSILILAYYLGIYAVALGVLVGSLSKLLIQLTPRSPLKGFSLKRHKAQVNVYLVEIWKLFFIIVSVLLLKEGIMMIARIFASHYEGDVSILNYGYVTAQVPLLIIETLTIYLFYPFFVKRSISPNTDEFKSTILKFIRVIFFILVPISILMMILSGLISRVLFLHGKFDWGAADKTAEAIAFFSFGLLGLAIDSIALRVAIILKRVRGYSFLLILRLTINVLLNIILIKYLNPIIALSLAFSLASIFNGILLMGYMGRAINHRFGLAFFNFIGKIILNSAIVGIVAFGIKWLCENLSYLRGFLSRLTVLSTTLIIGTGIYLLLAHIMKLKELDLLRTIWAKEFKL